MPIRNIITDKDPSLRKKSREITEFNSRLHSLLDDLTDTLKDAEGAGLAAPQVGVLRRACVIMREDGDYLELCNPKIVKKRGEVADAEGCLSIKGQYGIVSRPEYVEIEAFDRNGKPIKVEGEEFLARVLCHELDHLDGIIYTDIAKRILTPEELIDEMLEEALEEGE